MSEPATADVRMKAGGRTIVFVTGTRADYGKLEPLAEAAHELGFDVEFFVTGMHMLRRYGMTKREVQANASFKLVEYINQRHGDPLEAVLAKTMTGFSDYLAERKPDLVVVHGDRVEALAASLVCAMQYVRCAHVEGGEVSGTIDEVFRHCNSKLASYHLVSSDDAKQRVLRLGEPGETVQVIGSPELDLHSRPTGLTIDTVRDRYAIAFDDFGIAVFHPVTSERDTIAKQAEALMEALAASGRNFIVIMPNNDPGTEGIFSAIDKLPKERFRLLPSMRFLHFSELMRNCGAIVGNSSLGVREAPFLGVPSLDIGTRQANRAEAPSITHAAADDRAAIERFLNEEWGKRYETHSAFGEGNARERFQQVLMEDAFWNRPLQKRFCDND